MVRDETEIGNRLVSTEYQLIAFAMAFNITDNDHDDI